MANGKTQAILVTAEHLLVCEVQTQSQRLLDNLMDERTSFVQIQQVHVCRRAAAAAVVKTLDNAVVAKELLLLAILGGASHEAPTIRLTKFTRKRVCSAFLIVSGYEVQGRLHYCGTCEPVPLLHSEMMEFIPVTQATVCCDRGQPIPGSVVLVNKAHVSLLQVADLPMRQEEMTDTVGNGYSAIHRLAPLTPALNEQT